MDSRVKRDEFNEIRLAKMAGSSGGFAARAAERSSSSGFVGVT
jgi:hypothetical protein